MKKKAKKDFEATRASVLKEMAKPWQNLDAKRR
jgi:hypothetical protein